MIGDFAERLRSVLSGCSKGAPCQFFADVSPRVGLDTKLLKRVPLSAIRTFANPFRTFLSAVVADVCYLILRHNTTKVRIIFLVTKFIINFA